MNYFPVFTFSILLLFGCMSSVYSGDIPNNLALVIQSCRKEHQQTCDRFHLPLDTDYSDYLNLLETNWASTMQRAPKSFKGNIGAAHESMQFYFAGRTNYERETIETLLLPRVPINTALLDQNLKTNLGKQDLEIRLAWFRLAVEIKPTEVIKNDPHFYFAGILQAFLSDFRADHLCDVMADTDLNVIYRCIDDVPVFSDAYLNDLISAYRKDFPGVGEYSGVFSNRLLLYKKLSENLMPPNYSAINVFTKNLLNKKPGLFETRMLALEAWIKNELEHVASVIEATDKSKDGKSMLAKHNLTFVNQALMEIANANIPQTNRFQANVIPKLTEENLGLVRELNKYLRYRGRSFDVDYVSNSAPVLAALQAGDWKKATAGIQLDDGSANLTLPIAIFADFVQRSPNDSFKADLQLINARLEELRNHANKMAAE